MPKRHFLVTVDVFIKKMKGKHLVCLVFTGDKVFFEGTRENNLHISGPKMITQIKSAVILIQMGSDVYHFMAV